MRLALVSVVFLVAGCGLVVNLDGYRPCANAGECSRDAASDVTSDADAAVPAKSCSTNADCQLPTPACSQSVCAAVQTLVRGTVSYQCAILTDQKLWCWGANDHGQLGRGAIGGQESIPAPVTVLPPAARVLQAGMGNDFACALTDDNIVRCWGEGVGGNGIGSAILVSLPTGAIELSEGSSGACARLADKTVYCWGHNDWGDLGCSGATKATAILAQAPHLLFDASADIAHISVGYQSTCAVQNNSDHVSCVGDSAWGNLANGVTGSDLECQQGSASGFAASVTHMDSGDLATCVQDANGDFFCWGVNYVSFQSGLLWPPFHNGVADDAFSSPRKIPVPMETNRTTKSISIGWKHTCALLSNGEVVCWGDSGLGQTGVVGGVVAMRTVAGLTDVRDVAAHRHFTCARQGDGQVLCWGDNETQVIGPVATLGKVVPAPTPIAWH